MLFNTAWLKKPVEVQPLADLLSTAKLKAWLEKQPINKVYNYGDPMSCLLAQYVEAHGHTGVFVGTHTIRSSWFGKELELPRALYTAVTPKPHTYGEALRRLRTFA